MQMMEQQNGLSVKEDVIIASVISRRLMDIGHLYRIKTATVMS